MNIFDYETSFDSSLIIPQVTDILQNLSERMAKITQAIILITNIIPSNQDTLGLLRQFSRQTIVTLSDIQQIESYPDRVRTSDIKRLFTQIKHVMQCNELCHSAGLVSDMNYTILLYQLQKVVSIIDQRLMTYCVGQVSFPFRVHQITGGAQSTEQGGFSLEEYFNENETIPKDRESIKKTFSTQVVQSFLEKDNKDNIEKIISQQTQLQKESYRKKDIQHVIPERTPKQSTPTIIPTSHMSEKNISIDDKKERRDAIMKAIRSKGTVTIKDISENITGCSEKTIQRDLQELIQHGVLIREGEKRWAVYKLAMKNI